MLRKLLLLLCLALIACKSTPNASIDRIIIKNRTITEITNVKISVPATSAVVSTSSILPMTEYVLGIPETETQGNRAILSWQQSGQFYQRDLHTLIPKDADYSKPFNVVILITDRGEVVTFLD
ncbi:hypothetical protein [Coraliomargarita akajimensis]|uniref:Lipoprotein n=1 Tax=Coraliomargarita akajimensis (strain DSM 45221 / IAM 15411 / JCM 23193 / KCTC 12865 / 04OKA010-24) TaxID=583355 RepID=D5EHR8_CORAD|nr:hypothetical protein [Coraliomargarita akajimensis]ADE54109.1 hypothetical protein Caka_1088 [Coraliomargarita akajimensis DSM 45221]